MTASNTSPCAAGPGPADRRPARLLRLRVEGDRQAVHAVAGVLRGHVLATEDVAQVGVAAGAADLGAEHAVGAVVDLLDGARDGIVERGPAAVGVELGGAVEELGAA